MDRLTWQQLRFHRGERARGNVRVWTVEAQKSSEKLETFWNRKASVTTATMGHVSTASVRKAGRVTWRRTTWHGVRGWEDADDKHEEGAGCLHRILSPDNRVRDGSVVRQGSGSHKILVDWFLSIFKLDFIIKK